MNEPEQRVNEFFALLSLIALTLSIVSIVVATLTDGETAIKWALIALALGMISKVLGE